MSTAYAPPNSPERFRHHMQASLETMWANEWSRRSEAAGLRWFRYAWQDACAIIEQTAPTATDALPDYAARIEQQLHAIHWQYAHNQPDADGHVDSENWYAAVIYTVKYAMLHILDELSLNEREVGA